MNRAEKAVELFKSGCNCSQAVVCAFSDIIGIDMPTAMKASEGFGGGMGRMRLTCGAVSGMAMTAGLMMSKGEAGDLQTRAAVYAKVQEMSREFEEKNGSVICAELLGAEALKNKGAIPTKRTEEFYKKRPCIGCIKDCAEILEKHFVKGSDNV